MLQQVGTALDEHRPVRVHIHGLVALEQKFPIATSAEENGDERQGKRRSTARSRKGAARRKGPPRGSRKAAAAPRIGGDILRAAYEGQVTCVAEAYPTLQTFPDDDGMWLLATSSIIPDLAREAIFLVALPYRRGLGPVAWAFWTAQGQSWWIGPRHTNYQNGSICAFSEDDGAWCDGGDIRTLLDLYSLWALRHLHLEVFGRWPGKQYSLRSADPRVEAYYRQTQCEDDELCGCGSETRRYADCCKPSDLQWNFFELMSLFRNQVGGDLRKPPPPIAGFIESRSALPRITDIHPKLISA